MATGAERRSISTGVRFLTTLFDEKDIVLFRPIETWVEGQRKRSRVVYKQILYRAATESLMAFTVEQQLEVAIKERANVFFGVCPRFGAKNFDLAWQIRVVRVLWADIDHTIVEEALAKVRAAGLPEPSIAVNSGNGVHLYWLLDGPYLIDDVGDPILVEKRWFKEHGKNKSVSYIVIDGQEIDIHKHKNLLPDLSPKAERFQDILAGIAAVIGGDHTQDLSRLLRVPGTLNRKDEKNGREPKPTELVCCDPTKRYSLSTFEHLAKESPPAKRREAISQVALPTPRKLTPKRKDNLNEAISACRVATQGNRSETDFAACCLAIELGVTDNELWQQVSEIGKFKERGKEYFDHTWGKAANRVRTNKYEQLTGKTVGDDQALGDEDADDHRPFVVVGVDEAAVADQVISALATTDEVYQRGGRLVHIVEGAPVPECLERPKEALRIVPISSPRIRELITLSVRLLRVDDDELVPCHPPEWLVRAIEHRGSWANIRPLEGIVEAPVMLADGSILQTPGYDPRSGLYYGPSEDFPTVPDQPTREDAIGACEAILEIVVDFPFVKSEHRMAWLAAMVTPAAKFAYQGPAPLFAIDANSAGSGKSLLVDAISIVHSGGDASRTSPPGDDEECRKKITSIALAAEPMVLIDNVEGVLGCPSLDAALTATRWSDRVLGKSQMTGAIPLITLWFATGNNLVYGDDTPRRVLPSRLDCKAEEPEAREGFRHPELLLWVKKERPRLAVAIVTLLRAYHIAGRPAQPLSAWGSYEGWSQAIRAPIVWCGFVDPAKARLDIKSSSNRKREQLRLFMAAWDEVDPNGEGTTIANAVKSSSAGPAMATLLAECSSAGKPVSVRSLGMKLHHLQGKVCGGRRFIRDEGDWGAVWRIETIVVAESEEPAGSGTTGTKGTNPDPLTREKENHIHAHAHTCMETGGNSACSPRSPCVTVACDHTNPAAWVRRGDQVLCPGCGKFMGNVTGTSASLLGTEASK